MQEPAFSEWQCQASPWCPCLLFLLSFVSWFGRRQVMRLVSLNLNVRYAKTLRCSVSGWTVVIGNEEDDQSGEWPFFLREPKSFFCNDGGRDFCPLSLMLDTTQVQCIMHCACKMHVWTLLERHITSCRHSLLQRRQFVVQVVQYDRPYHVEITQFLSI